MKIRKYAWAHNKHSPYIYKKRSTTDGNYLKTSRMYSELLI